jgi:hypothetical protein
VEDESRKGERSGKRTSVSPSLSNRIDFPLVHVLDLLHVKLSLGNLLIRHKLFSMLLVKSRDDDFVGERLDGFVAEVGGVGDEVVDDSLTGLSVSSCKEGKRCKDEQEGEGKGKRTGGGISAVEEVTVAVNGL